MQNRSRNIRLWLTLVALLVWSMVIIGGITRLTGSGLSMVEWKLLLGIIPPLHEADWMTVFERYKAFPEYQIINHQMSLGEFKSIFFWEYLHRLIGRGIGLVVLVPFFFFLIKKQLSGALIRRLLIGFFLGALQGLVGWYMVKSGLIDNPHVSHYRLAIHLGLALFLFSYLVWLLFDLKEHHHLPFFQKSPYRAVSLSLLTVLIIQIIWGAFMAGKKAGILYSTFPLMGQHFIPDGLMALEPPYLNIFENGIAIHFLHRTLGWVLLFGSALLAVLLYKTPKLSRASLLFFLAICIQFILGVSTVVLHVPIVLGVIHQAFIPCVLLAALHLHRRLLVCSTDTKPPALQSR